MKRFIVFLLSLLTVMGTLAQKKYAPSVTPEQRLVKTYNINLFRTGEGTWFDLQNDNGSSGAISYINILDWLQGRVPGLVVYHYRGITVPFLRGQPATVFVDEMRVDYSFLDVLPVSDIGLIKVMPNAAITGAGVSSAIAIYTKRGEGDDEKEMPSP